MAEFMRMVDIPARSRVAALKPLLEVGENIRVIERFATQKTLGKGKGRTYQLRRRNRLSLAPALAEQGLDPLPGYTPITGRRGSDALEFPLNLVSAKTARISSNALT